jgi:hypothetical protein
VAAAERPDVTASWPAWVDSEHDPLAAMRALVEDLRGLNDGLDEHERLGSDRPPKPEEPTLESPH